MPPPLRITSGGQTGADLGALVAARLAGVPTGGHAPSGWQTESGPAPWLADYGLVQCPGPGYPARTRRNVKAADACLWFGNPASPGGRLTLGLCRQEGVAHFVVLTESTPADAAAWLREYVFPGREGVTLLVAGNRESSAPGIGARVEAFVSGLLGLLEGDPP
jgi:hypothetical protein